MAAVVLAAVLVAAPDPAVAATGSTPARTCAGSASYLVASGDTWFDIARAAEVSMGALLGANAATEDRVLHPDDVLCLPAGAVVASTCSPSNAPTHTVAPGDTWWDVARAAEVSMGALLGANAATEDRVLHPDDVLCLPLGATRGAPAAARSSAAGASVASGQGSNVDVGDGDRYVVERGDGWFDIARRAGVSMRALLGANDASEARLLHPGDVIRLPAGADVSGVTTANRGSTSNVELQALPVQGPCWYEDGWHAPRAGGRVHLGVDYFTVPGQYVYAVVDGTLTGRAWDQPGRRAGNAWWLTAADGTGTYFFYAHLSDFPPDLEVGSRVRAGQIIGWVGDTGNAGAPHLHFEVHPDGVAAVNPFPIVRAQGGCNRGAPYEQPGGWVPTARGD